MSNKKVWLSPPHMSGKELSFIQEAFDANWIAPLGPNLQGFEDSLASYTGAAHVAALSSGTAAIHLALILLGVQRDDFVLVSSFTFSASANPIVYQGAIPVFIESEPDTWNISPEFLRESIEDLASKGKKPKALILVHLYGMPALMDELVSICQEYDIPIIEDAAEALGSAYDGKKLGSFGELGVLSFNGNKIITTSGGGALLSDNEQYIEQAKFLATQARDPAPHYEHSQIGYNYRMSNIVAGIGRGQLEVIDERVRRRREIFEYYHKQLGKLPGLSFCEEPEKCFSNRWLTTLLVRPEETAGITQEDIRNRLESLNIESRPLWKPMHLQPVFQEAPYYGNRFSESLFELGLCLPSGTAMDEETIDRICGEIEELMGG